MTDRELLELAAKAAGVKHNGWLDSQYAGEYGGLRVGPPRLWNPLTDDGDALRLAVKLFLKIEHHDDSVVVWDEYLGTGYIPYDGDPCAATRRAITSCAAAIGEAM